MQAGMKEGKKAGTKVYGHRSLLRPVFVRYSCSTRTRNSSRARGSVRYDCTSTCLLQITDRTYEYEYCTVRASAQLRYGIVSARTTDATLIITPEQTKFVIILPHRAREEGSQAWQPDTPWPAGDIVVLNFYIWIGEASGH